MGERSDERGRAVPQGRGARLARLGGLTGGIAREMAVGGLRELGQGRRPRAAELLLTPTNMQRIANELSRMRGAAMKAGQLLSMEAGEILPPELSAILARLRDSAEIMPPRQLRSVLASNWGHDFTRRFARFDVRPIAAASIGQVHRAQTRDGRDLAIKVQYPGIRGSIDSDVDNIAALIRLTGVAFDRDALARLMEEAKRQLHEEADYAREADRLRAFGALLAQDADFAVPDVHEDFTTPDILAMSYLDGRPVEAMANEAQEVRDSIAGRLIALCLRELFEFRLMQTDPNFANYRYDAEGDRIVLLDFGATRAFADETAEAYRHLLRAGLDEDALGIREGARATGIFGPAMMEAHGPTIETLFEIAFAPLRRTAPFDFGEADLIRRLGDAAQPMVERRTAPHVPPNDTLYLQRKVAGLYLLACRLRARVALRPILEPHARQLP